MNTPNTPEVTPNILNNLAVHSRRLMIGLGATTALAIPGVGVSHAATGDRVLPTAEKNEISPGRTSPTQSVGQVVLAANHSRSTRRKNTHRRPKKPEWVRSIDGPRELGVAVSTRYMNQPTYLEHIKNRFDVLVPENEGKSQSLIPTLSSVGNPLFSPMDKIIDTAVSNGQSVRYHSIVFGDQDPPWIRKIGYRCRDNFLGGKKQASREMGGILDQYTLSTASRYKGRVKDIDVVNEPLEKYGQMERNAWYECLNTGYLDKAFRLAHAADDQAKLYLNEFNAELPGPKQDALFELIKGMQARGVPIHGVGLQTHVDLKFINSIKEFEQTLKRFASLGIIVKLTELDVALPKNPSAEDFKQQTKVYEAVVKACIKQAACGDVIVWGASDDKSWLSHNSPTLFGMKGVNYVPKPAYKIVRRLLR